MSFLEDLPCQNPDNFSLNFALYKKHQGFITRSLGQGGFYLPLEQDTKPPPNQVIKTDETNLLLRFLANKQNEENRFFQSTHKKANEIEENEMNVDQIPSSPYQAPVQSSIKDSVSDQELEKIDNSLEQKQRSKRSRNE